MSNKCWFGERLSKKLFAAITAAILAALISAGLKLKFLSIQYDDRFHTCEVCGHLARTATRDMVQIGARGAYTRFVPVEDFRFYCFKHQRPALLYMLGGSIQEFDAGMPRK